MICSVYYTTKYLWAFIYKFSYLQLYIYLYMFNYQKMCSYMQIYIYFSYFILERKQFLCKYCVFYKTHNNKIIDSIFAPIISLFIFISSSDSLTYTHHSLTKTDTEMCCYFPPLPSGFRSTIIYFLSFGLISNLSIICIKTVYVSIYF